MSLSFTSQDRIFVVAPHPDDESLATGGLILRAIRAGAAVRVVFATDGDNNPWPQRWVEKRWRIGGEERRRWGSTRRQEATAAVRRLGLPDDAAHFFGFPDQGMTPRLLKADEATVEQLAAELRGWQPTLVVLPSPHDLHPDHNALYILFQTALERAGLSGVRQLHFLVHCRRPDRVPGRVEIVLPEEDRLRKREAILCHETQMVLSRKRFVAYARPVEAYYEPVPAEPTFPGHRVPQAMVANGALALQITLPHRRWAGTSLFIAVETASGANHRWRLRLPLSTHKARLRDAGTGAPLRWASVRIKGRIAEVRIPIAPVRPLARVFVKLHRRTLFLDDVGWREVPLPTHPLAAPAWVPTREEEPEWELPPDAEPGLEGSA